VALLFPSSLFRGICIFYFCSCWGRRHFEGDPYLGSFTFPPSPPPQPFFALFISAAFADGRFSLISYTPENCLHPPSLVLPPPVAPASPSPRRPPAHFLPRFPELETTWTNVTSPPMLVPLHHLPFSSLTKHFFVGCSRHPPPTFSFLRIIPMCVRPKGAILRGRISVHNPPPPPRREDEGVPSSCPDHDFFFSHLIQEAFSAPLRVALGTDIPCWASLQRGPFFFFLWSFEKSFRLCTGSLPQTDGVFTP